MNNLQKLIAVVLVTCLLFLPLGDVATSLQAATPPNPALAKQQVGLFGVGAKVKIQLADGKKLKGSISAVENEAFLLTSKQEDPPRRVAYDQVAQLKLAKLKYRAKGAPDPVEARRVVLGLGVGHHIQVKTTAGKEYHGNIHAIDSDAFSMLPDRETTPVQIAFADVRYVESNLGKVAKIAIAVVVGLAIASIVVFKPWRSE